MAAAKEPSEVRLLYKDPQGSVIPPLFTAQSKVMSNQETDLTKQVVMPFINKPVYREDDKLVIWLKCVASDTVVLSSSKVQIPVTTRNTRTGVINRTYLDENDFSEVDGGTDGIAFVADTGAEFASYTIPAGVELKLGHVYSFNSRIMISPYDDTA